MAEINIPKDTVDMFRKAAAAKMGKPMSDLEKSHLQNIVDEPTWAMFAILRPYLKGDLLYLSQQIAYGDLEASDDGDGYYRITIPDEKLSSNLPPEFGKVNIVPKSPKSFSRHDREEMITNLCIMSSLLLGQAGPGVMAFLEDGATAFSKLLNSPVTTDELVTAYSSVATNIAGRGVKTLEAQEVLHAADAVSQKLDDDERMALATALFKLAGGSALKPPAGIAEQVLVMCYLQLGVLWDREHGAFSMDPAGNLKKIALKVSFEQSAGADEK